LCRGEAQPTNKLSSVKLRLDTIEEREKRKEIIDDHRKVKKLVPQHFHKWKKMFGKVESERMPTRKPWDHTIDLKENFVLRKE